MTRYLKFCLTCKQTCFIFLGDIEPRIRNATVTETSRTYIKLSWIVDMPDIETKIWIVPEEISPVVIPYETINSATLKSLVPGSVYQVFLKPIPDDTAVDPDTIVLEVSTFPTFADIQVESLDSNSVGGPFPGEINGRYSKMVMSILPKTDGLVLLSATLDSANSISSWEFSPLQPNTDYELTLDIYGTDESKGSKSMATVHTPCAETFFVKKVVENDGSVKMTFGTVGICDAIAYGIRTPDEELIVNTSTPFQKELIQHFSEELMGSLFMTMVLGMVNSQQSDYAINKVGFFYEVRFEPSTDFRSLVVIPRYSNGLISEYEVFSTLLGGSRHISTVSCVIGTICTIYGLEQKDEIFVNLVPLYEGYSGQQFDAVFLMPFISIGFSEVNITQNDKVAGAVNEKIIVAQFFIRGKTDSIQEHFTPIFSGGFTSKYKKSFAVIKF